MRDIKFRAWDKKIKEMFAVHKLEFREIDGKVGEPTMIMGYSSVGCGSFEGRDLFGGCNMKRLEFMQYTGLPDKNGNEIYEGDIWKSVENGIESVGVVEYYGCSFRVRYNFVSELLGLAVRYGEVIGNIYEHYHLLEAQP